MVGVVDDALSFSVSRLTMQLSRSEIVRSDLSSGPDNDVAVKYWYENLESVRFVVVGSGLDGAASRTDVADGAFVDWDAGAAFRLNKNFVLGMFTALRSCRSCS